MPKPTEQNLNCLIKAGLTGENLAVPQLSDRATLSDRKPLANNRETVADNSKRAHDNSHGLHSLKQGLPIQGVLSFHNFQGHNNIRTVRFGREVRQLLNKVHVCSNQRVRQSCDDICQSQRDICAACFVQLDRDVNYSGFSFFCCCRSFVLSWGEKPLEDGNRKEGLQGGQPYGLKAAT